MNLTPKQEKFCQCYVSGMSGYDSYKAAYDTKGKDSTINQEVVRLLAREDIQERIETLSKPIIKAAQNTAISEREKKRAIIWEGIEACRNSGDHSGIARYMDILNKMDAEYININKTIEDKTSDIKELDKSVLEKLVMSS